MTNICFTCIGDDYLKNNCTSSIITRCDYCHNTNIPCLSAENLAEMLKPIVDLYSPVEEFMPMEEMKDRAGSGDNIWGKMQIDWELFPELDYDDLEKLFTEMYYSQDDANLILSSEVENERDYYGMEFEATDDLYKEWKDFCDEIITTNRFFPKKTINNELLMRAISYLETDVQIETNFFRARIWDASVPYPIEEMGMPPVYKAKSGRANPIGIPYLYLASDQETAISEIRPMPLDKITLGTFHLLENFKIIDLAKKVSISPFQFGDHIADYFYYRGLLDILGKELSKPIPQQNSNLEYIPLQYLCEFIKTLGYEGVAYKSSIGDGYNLAAFSDTKFSCISIINVEITRVGYIYNLESKIDI